MWHNKKQDKIKNKGLKRQRNRLIKWKIKGRKQTDKRKRMKANVSEENMIKESRKGHKDKCHFRNYRSNERSSA